MISHFVVIFRSPKKRDGHRPERAVPVRVVKCLYSWPYGHESRQTLFSLAISNRGEDRTNLRGCDFGRSHPVMAIVNVDIARTDVGTRYQ